MKLFKRVPFKEAYTWNTNYIMVEWADMIF